MGDIDYDSLIFETAVEPADDDVPVVEDETEPIYYDTDNLFEVAVEPPAEGTSQPNTPPAPRAMLSGPALGQSAEIVLLVTSLGSVRRSFFSSWRLKNFFDCKAVTYFVIDANREFAEGAESADTELLERWKNGEANLTREADDASKVIIPQVLIDGVSIGGETDVRDMDEDGMLDWVLSRSLCPSCGSQKNPETSPCDGCGVDIRCIIPPEFVEANRVQFYQRGGVPGTNYRCPKPRCFEEAPVGGILTMEDLFG